MHGSRQRSFGNGYRSGSRISPERPIRGRGFYGSDHHHHHRGFNRGYGRGRGRSKSFQNQLPPPPPVQRRSCGGGGGDVFMEAGRLAAEYLVTQGVLPETVLSSKGQDGNFRKFQSSKEAAAAPGGDRRRFVDGYNSAGSRRRSNRYDSDFDRSGSWSERSKAYEAGDDSGSGHREEQPLAEDIASSVQRSTTSGEFMRKREGAGDSEFVLDKYSLQDEAQSKTASSSAGKEVVHDCEISKVSEGSSSLSAGSGEMKGRIGGENESQAAIEDAPVLQHCEDASIDGHCGGDESFTESGIDLATLCKFEKVPTRTRSSLTAKGPKLYLSQNNKETSHNPGLPKEDQTEKQSETQGQSSGYVNNQVEDLPLVQFVENNKCNRSNSFPNSILRESSEKEAGLDLPNMHRSHSLGKGGEKRAAEDSDLEEGAKRQRNWVPVPASETNEHFNVLKTSELQCGPEGNEKTSSFSRRLIDLGPGYAEEHQLFPASFKICDLNLGGGSDGANDGKRESSQPVGFDLSMSSSSKSLDFSTSTRMSNGKEIEVIDLDNDDTPDVVKSSNNPGRKQEAGAYMGINDVPDYNEGLMMVEYLDSFGNIPAINPGISTSVPQNNDVVVQDREVLTLLGNDQAPNNTDDDSIFMSLGEIPLTFLQTWDQPPARGYEKPF
uniref:Uncharacterized protein n=1 Tax=Brassica oleracea TaxID=3712 RepID=A0A3P6FAK0_BRAOL|nr:unnamed protein product [Brassica oleracea]